MALSSTQLRNLTLALILCCCQMLAAADVDSDTGPRYVADQSESPLRRPLSLSIRLSSEVPEDAQVDIQFRGSAQQYGQWRYGTEDSTRVLLAVDQFDSGEEHLYVDLNRNRVLEASERIAPEGSIYRFALETEITSDTAPKRYERSVQLRISRRVSAVSLTTLGSIHGSVAVGEQQWALRLVDSNANGLFNDLTDRVWLDLNRDGLWDPIAEQFPFTPILRLNTGRFAVRSDSACTQFALSEIRGEGRVRIDESFLAEGARLASAELMLYGEDGSTFRMSSEQSELTLPVGKYALGSVQLLMHDGKSSKPWRFVFSRSSGNDPRHWHEVANGEVTDIQPVRDLQFDLQMPEMLASVPGAVIDVRLLMTTADGLGINSCCRGEQEEYQNSTSAEIALSSPTQGLLASAKSGFQ